MWCFRGQGRLLSLPRFPPVSQPSTALCLMPCCSPVQRLCFLNIIWVLDSWKRWESCHSCQGRGKGRAKGKSQCWVLLPLGRKKVEAERIAFLSVTSIYSLEQGFKWQNHQSTEASANPIAPWTPERSWFRPSTINCFLFSPKTLHLKHCLFMLSFLKSGYRKFTTGEVCARKNPPWSWYSVLILREVFGVERRLKTWRILKKFCSSTKTCCLSLKHRYGL